MYTHLYVHLFTPLRSENLLQTDWHETSHITSIHKNNTNHNAHKIKSQHQNIRTYLCEVTLSHITISYI
jgi:hypothetical protein